VIRIAAVAACFLLSGFAGLLYQIVWMRLFSATFGTSELAVAIVLAGYMGGLSIGAAVAARYIDRVSRPVLLYGLLEGGIALSALAVPWLISATGHLLVRLVGHQPIPPSAADVGQPLFFGLAAMLIMLVPTGLMGATLPLLARYAVNRDRDLGRRVSILYTTNTVGAIAGAVLTGFYLLPTLGLRGTSWVGIAVNALILVAACGLASQDSESFRLPQQLQRHGLPRRSRYVLMLVCLTGCLSFAYEVLWTRMLSLVVGSSVYAFSAMLAAFLTGIALGAAGAGAVVQDRRTALSRFAWCQLGIALASAIVYSKLQAPISSHNHPYLLSFAVMLPATLFIGATFPLAVRAVAEDARDAGTATATVYAWNTVGAILGATITGYYVLPALGFAGTVLAAVVGNLLLAILAMAISARSVPRFAIVRIGAAVLFLPAMLFLFQPERPIALLSTTHFGGSYLGAGREVHYRVGRSSTVSLTENSARFDLATNGLPEAQIEFLGAPPAIVSQRWLALWPSLFKPQIDHLLVVGLGGGVALENVPPGVRDIDVVELEPEVARAIAKISRHRNGDVLDDDRVHLVFNDARNALQLTDRRYDAIVSQPSHPWTAGASHLFTHEYVALVRTRLNADGVFVQWMNADLIDERLLRRFLATLHAEFAYIRVFQPTPLALHFVASNAPLRLAADSGTPWSEPLAQAAFVSSGISDFLDIRAAELLDNGGARLVATDALPLTDDDNRMAFDTYTSATGLSSTDLLALTAAHDPLLKRGSPLRQHLGSSELLYLVRRLITNGELARVRRLIESIDQDAVRSVARAILLRHEGRMAEAIAEAEIVADVSEVPSEIALLRSEVATTIPSIENSNYRTEFASNDPLASIAQDGWRSYVQSDWNRLHSLDSALADLPLTNLWAPFIAQVRAEWRVALDTSNGEHCREALIIVDQSLIVHPTVGGLFTRARAAKCLNDTPTLIESIPSIIAIIHREMSTAQSNDRPLSLSERETWLAMLDELIMAVSAAGEDTSSRALTVLEQLLRTREMVNSSGYDQ